MSCLKNSIKHTKASLINDTISKTDNSLILHTEQHENRNIPFDVPLLSTAWWLNQVENCQNSAILLDHLSLSCKRLKLNFECRIIWVLWVYSKYGTDCAIFHSNESSNWVVFRSFWSSSLLRIWKFFLLNMNPTHVTRGSLWCHVIAAK